MAFVWERSTGDVSDYLLQIALSGDDIRTRSFRRAEFVVLDPGSGNVRFTGDLGDGDYQWRVVARDAALNTASSETRSFAVDTLAPGAPVLVLPVSGDLTNDNTPFFDWERGIPVWPDAQAVGLLSGNAGRFAPASSPASALTGGT